MQTKVQKLLRVLNAYCKTGKGGGQDNSCSPRKGGEGEGKPPSMKGRFGASGMFDSWDRSLPGVGKLSGEERTVISQWREPLWEKARVTRLARHTVAGGSLENLHPGEITIYRGGAQRSRGGSWSKSKAVARRYAGPKGKVQSMKLTKDVPALDINKAIGTASKSAVDREVFVVLD